MSDAATIAAGLTKAQRKFINRRSYRLTPLGLAVHSHLAKEAGHAG